MDELIWSLTNDVRAARTVKGWSQTELADKIGISRNALSSIERGESIPSIFHCLALAKVLHYSVAELFSVDKPSVFCPVCGGSRPQVCTLPIYSSGTKDYFCRCRFCFSNTSEYFSADDALEAFADNKLSYRWSFGDEIYPF